jgi:hypothetical protein
MLGHLEWHQTLKTHPCEELATSTDENHTASDINIPDILVPWVMARAALIPETAYSNAPCELIIDLMCIIQSADLKTGMYLIKLKTGDATKLSNLHWTLSKDSLLRFRACVYILKSSAIRFEIMCINHDDPQGGYLGFKRMLEAIRSRYYWHGIHSDVKTYVKSCLRCQEIAVYRYKSYSLL